MRSSSARRRCTETQRVLRGAQGLVEYDRGSCPDHLLTRRQVRDRQLSPGHEPVGILRCTRCRYRPKWACLPGHRGRGYLYDVRLTRPKRVPTLAQEWALDRAMAARQTCPRPGCGRRYIYVLPWRTLGCCLECHDGTPADPATYTLPPAKHRLAA
ncbi:RRQRL motif-containing zinc-binding protein [Streptomyces sp. NPDC002952]|uniref:RRQRL motif-containing zinc-binding protein n=1 Tax=Streptomyces sp. NPDC002952 TaxID=3364673 RepID=UPI0036AD1938